jgi:WD40 repeat protein
MPVYFSDAGLQSLKRGLEKAGIGAETFELEPESDGAFGWRAPYRGLEALQAADAAVFFGRSADIVRGIDALRGLAARHPPRLLVVLGASGAGKSSYLRASLWPRLNRDDSQWLPLTTIRTGRDGAIEGDEGLLSSLEDVPRRFALRANRAELRSRLASSDTFAALLRDLRKAAARRAHISQPPFPLPLLCLDQGEEFFFAEHEPQCDKLLQLVRGAIETGEALLLITIRSDAFGSIQNSQMLTGIDPIILSLRPVPPGEIAYVIRGPSEVLRRKAGQKSPGFDAPVVERLQEEIIGENDALPLLAFVLQRLVREHANTPLIGIKELEQTGGVAAAIEAAAEAALTDAGVDSERSRRLDVLRRLFIPHLARVDRESKLPRRRVAPQAELPADLGALTRALIARRLLVIKRDAKAEDSADSTEPTVEVAHEALLRRWPMLAELLQEDRDALVLLDGLLSAAADWKKASSERKIDFLAHRGSRLADSQSLGRQGSDWHRAISPAREYLIACTDRETEERNERTLALERRVKLQRYVQLGTVAATLFLALIALAAGWQWRDAVRERNAALVTQSRFLADQANQRSEAGDASAAIALSLEALPSKDGNRPESSEAQTSLLTALQQLREKNVLVGHTEQVWSAQFSGDSQTILTGSRDGTARLWDRRTGRQLYVFGEETPEGVRTSISPDGRTVATVVGFRNLSFWNAVTGLKIADTDGHVSVDRTERRELAIINGSSFSPDSQRFVTSSQDRTARIWSSQTGKIVLILAGHTDLVGDAEFSADGLFVVTASEDRTARIWNAQTGKVVHTLSGHEDSVYRAQFSRDGERVLTLSKDRTIRIWKATSGDLLFTLRHTQDIGSAQFDGSGKHVLTATSDGIVRIWDSSTGDLALSFGGLTPHRAGVLARFSPDGERVITLSGDNIAHLWNSRTGELQASFSGHSGEICDVQFSPDGDEVATASYDRTSRIWGVKGLEEARIFSGHSGAITAAHFSHNGERLVTASEDGTAKIWDVESGAVVRTVTEGAEITSSSFSPDDRYVLTAAPDANIRVWDVDKGNAIVTIRSSNYSVGIAQFSPDGKKIAASSGRIGHLWEVQTGQTILTLEGHSADIDTVQFSADGRRLLTGSAWWDQTARLWDMQTGSQIATFKAYIPARNTILLSPDGELVVTRRDAASGHDRGAMWTGVQSGARVWDANTAKAVAELVPVKRQTIDCMAFDAVGKLLAIAFYNEARIWRTDNMSQIASLRGHDGKIRQIGFDAEGKRLVTSADDGSARIWDLNGNSMARLPHEGISSAEFSPNGRLVVTASKDGTARIWRIYPSLQSLVEQAKAVAPRCLSVSEREKAFLGPRPPDWCILQNKWPYHTPGWKKWLTDTRAGLTRPLPRDDDD